MGTIRNGGETKEEMKMMEWEKQEQQQQQQNGVMMYVKVMTDEQMELLRKQISIYATICEELVEMHKAITAQRDLAAYAIAEGRPVRERRLPCCGIGVGWFLFIIGFFLAAIPWYVGAFVLLCVRRMDYREKPGYIACTIAAILVTIAAIIGATKGTHTW